MAIDQVQKALGERFSFKIKNTTGAAKVIAILAAYFDTLKITSVNDVVTKTYTDATEIAAAGYVVDHVIDDGTIVAGLVCTPLNAKFGIRAFREYIKHQGRVLVDMTVSANTDTAFDNVMEIAKVTPTAGSAAQGFPLSDFYSVDQTSKSKINVRNIGLELAFDTLWLLPIGEGEEIILTLRF